jgi:hypothetical protein
MYQTKTKPPWIRPFSTKTPLCNKKNIDLHQINPKPSGEELTAWTSENPKLLLFSFFFWVRNNSALQKLLLFTDGQSANNHFHFQTLSNRLITCTSPIQQKSHHSSQAGVPQVPQARHTPLYALLSVLQKFRAILSFPYRVTD